MLLNLPGRTAHGCVRLHFVLSCAALSAALLGWAGEAAPQRKELDALKRFEEPKRFSLSGKGLTVKEALDKLKETYGWGLNVQPATLLERKIDLEIKDAAYFQALEALRTSAKLGYQFNNDPKEGELPLKFVELAEKASIHVVVAGPFILLVKSVDYVKCRGTDFARKRKKEVDNYDHLDVNAVLLSEPGVTFCAPQVRDVEFSGLPVGCTFLNFRKHLYDYSSRFSRVFFESTAGYSVNADKELQGSLSWKGVLAVSIPKSLEKRRIDDLKAVAGNPIDLPGGGKITFQAAAAREDGYWQGAYSPSGTDVGLANIAYDHGIPGGLVVAETMSPDQPGVFFLDSGGRFIGERGGSYDVTEDGVYVSKFLTAEPKAALIRSYAGFVEKKYEVKLEGIPLP